MRNLESQLYTLCLHEFALSVICILCLQTMGRADLEQNGDLSERKAGWPTLKWPQTKAAQGSQRPALGAILFQMCP